jgi:hypothetical protein
MSAQVHTPSNHEQQKVAPHLQAIYDTMKPHMPYQPKPLDVTKVKLTPELRGLQEHLAKNTHEIWAKLRLEQGWSHGPTRNDAEKKHPCLISYEDLPESEKVYDREISEGVLKAILSLGYTIHAASPTT